jgi:membrane protein YdbS with pleckstrin-like domain
MRVLVAQCPHCAQPVEATSEKLQEPVDCPHCKRPFEIEIPKAQVTQVREISDQAAARSRRLVQETPERELIKTHPAIFRGRPFSFIGCLLLVGLGAAGIVYGWMATTTLLIWIGATVAAAGLVVLLIWWLAALATTLTVTDRRTILRKGLLSRTTSEVEHDDIRNVQMDQSAVERLFGVGDIGISSSGQDDMEIIARSMPRPDEIVRIIRESQN